MGCQGALIVPQGDLQIVLVPVGAQGAVCHICRTAKPDMDVAWSIDAVGLRLRLIDERDCQDGQYSKQHNWDDPGVDMIAYIRGENSPKTGSENMARGSKWGTAC